MEDTTEPVAPETTATEVVDAELVDGQVAVGDDHDHAEGRGLPVVRTVGDVGAGWGLVPSGAIVLVRTLAEMTAWGAGWTQETTLAGLLPIGVGTTFSQTFAEATSYGTAWLHSHSDDHQHAGGSHTHGMQSHSHDLQSHTHSGGSHTHGMGHTHTLGSGGSSFLAALGGGAGSTNVSTDTHTHGGNTGSSSADPTGTPSASTSGTPSNNTSQGPSNNTSTGPSNNTTDAGNSTTSTGLKTSGTTTADATWLPPMRGMIYARKV